MIKGVQGHLRAISYAFTKYPETTDINALLSDIKRSKVDNDPILKSHEAFVAVLSDMIRKTRDETFKIDPIHGDRETLIEKLKEMTGIKNPDEVFDFAMSGETRTSIVNHTQKNKFNFMSAMKRKDIELVLYYLNDLKMLKDLINENNIEEVYANSVCHINESINHHYTEVTNKFNRAFASLDGLEEDDIREYKTSVEYFQQIQILNEHLKSIFIFTLLMEHLISRLHERKNILNKEDLYSPSIEIYLNNFRMLNNSFKELKADYISTCEEYGKYFEKLIQTVYEPIHSNQCQQVAEIILNIYKSAHVLRNHLHEQVDNKHIDTVKILLRHLSSFSDKADSLLAKNTLNNDDIELLKNDLEILISAKENFALQECISTYLEIVKIEMKF